MLFSCFICTFTRRVSVRLINPFLSLFAKNLLRCVSMKRKPSEKWGQSLFADQKVKDAAGLLLEWTNDKGDAIPTSVRNTLSAVHKKIKSLPRAERTYAPTVLLTGEIYGRLGVYHVYAEMEFEQYVGMCAIGKHLPLLVFSKGEGTYSYVEFTTGALTSQWKIGSDPLPENWHDVTDGIIAYFSTIEDTKEDTGLPPGTYCMKLTRTFTPEQVPSLDEPMELTAEEWADAICPAAGWDLDNDKLPCNHRDLDSWYSDKK